MANEITIVTQSFVNIMILTDTNEFGVEKRYAKDIKLDNMKSKLEMITGYECVNMKLFLLNREKKLICEMDDDSKMLGFYPIEDGFFIEVKSAKNLMPTEGEDPDFRRFELTDEEYAIKKGTVKDFKMRNKLGQYSDDAGSLAEKKARQLKEKCEQEERALESIEIGARCQVRVANAPTRLACVKYKGELGKGENKKPGYFVGVRYDEPLGKNDGSVDGHRYFECPPNYGGFVKPEFVTCGDFPEENFDEF